MNKLFKKVTISDKDLQLEPEDRIHCVGDLDIFFQPFGFHIDYGKQIDSVIRSGYLPRNPLLSNDDNPYRSKHSHSLLLTGPSGIGKTETTLQILSEYPQVIVHKDEYLTQVVWLKIECPSDGSLKSLCFSFFQEMQSILENVKVADYKRTSTREYLSEMQALASNYQLGVLVIDEIQRIFNNSKDHQKIIDFFVELNNQIKLPIIMIGLPNNIDFIGNSFSASRRFFSNTWSLLKKDQYWDRFINRLWTCSWLHNQPDLTDDFSNVIFFETQGVTDLVIKLYAGLQYKGLNDGSETFTLDDISRIASRIFINMKPMLNALKNKDDAALSKFADLCHFRVKDVNNIIDIEYSGEENTYKDSDDKIFNSSSKPDALKALVYADVPIRMADNIVEHFVKKNKSMEKSEIVEKGLAYYREAQKHKQQQSVGKLEVSLLPYLDQANGNSSSVYSLLIADDLIKSPVSEFEL